MKTEKNQIPKNVGYFYLRLNNEYAQKQTPGKNPPVGVVAIQVVNGIMGQQDSLVSVSMVSCKDQFVKKRGSKIALQRLYSAQNQCHDKAKHFDIQTLKESHITNITDRLNVRSNSNWYDWIDWGLANTMKNNLVNRLLEPKL